METKEESTTLVEDVNVNTDVNVEAEEKDHDHNPDQDQDQEPKPKPSLMKLSQMISSCDLRNSCINLANSIQFVRSKLEHLDRSAPKKLSTRAQFDDVYDFVATKALQNRFTLFCSRRTDNRFVLEMTTSIYRYMTEMLFEIVVPTPESDPKENDPHPSPEPITEEE